MLGKDGDVRANRSGTEEDWATRLARELGIVSFDPLSNQDGAQVSEKDVSPVARDVIPFALIL